MLTQPWDTPASAVGTSDAGTSLTSVRVAVSAIGEASTSEVAARICHEGAEAGLTTEDGRADGAPIVEAMDVDTTRQV